MTVIDRGHCHIETYAAGILGGFGHDLRLSVEDFEIRVDRHEATLEARFRPASIRVEGAMVDGDLDREELSDADRSEIWTNIRDDVLQFDDHETATFEGRYRATESGEALEVEGTLELVGHSEPVSTHVHRKGGRLRTELDLVQSRWGIEPYRAAMGALKVEDRVHVSLDVPDVREASG